MNVRLPLIAGLLLGGLVFVWQLVAAAIVAPASFFIPGATGLEAAVLIGLFTRLDRQAPWPSRAGAGVLASGIGALCAFGGSLLVTTVLFPDLLASLGPDPQSALDAAGGGFMGTLVMGAALSGVLAFLQRQRG